MTADWAAIAARAVEGVGVVPGDLVQVRDGAGRADVLVEVLLAVEAAGGTPVPELSYPGYLRRLLSAAPLALIERWHERRVWLTGAYDRVLSLHGHDRTPGDVPVPSWEAWLASAQHIVRAEEERRVPTMVVAVPTTERATSCRTTLDDLERVLGPALLVRAADLRERTLTVLGPLATAGGLALRSAGGRTLHLRRTGRTWLVDDGLIDDEDRSLGAVVSNLPAGSAYSTVVEDATEGEVALESLAGETGVVLRFDRGRGHVVATGAGAAGVARVEEWLGGFDGEPRRVGHLGIGTNPLLSGTLGWVLPDHGAAGRLWLSLGENRYMGGENASSLNVDAVVAEGFLGAG